MKGYNSEDSRAKFVYSAPITKSSKIVYTDANGTVKAINKDVKGKSTYMPRYTVCSILNDETRTLTFGLARRLDVISLIRGQLRIQYVKLKFQII